MKKAALLFFIVVALGLSAQNKSFRVKNHTFLFKAVSEFNDSGDSIRKVELFRNGKKLLAHTLSECVGDCNSESVELGTYEVTDTSIIFYSYWARAGDAPVSPYGVRKQAYSVDSAGKVFLVKAEMHIQTTNEDWSDKEIRKEIEQRYNAKFVSDNAITTLFDEVRSKLKKQINSKTKHWKTAYAESPWGYDK